MNMMCNLATQQNVYIYKLKLTQTIYAFYSCWQSWILALLLLQSSVSH